MNMRETFTDSLRYPFKDIKQFIILSILYLGAALIVIPIVWVFGYLYRIIEATLQGSKELPDFENLKELTINGLKFTGAVVVYLIPVYLLNLALLSTGTPAILLNGVVNKAIFLILGFLISILFIIALANMVHENRFMGVFDFKKIFEQIKQITWKKYLAYVVAYTVITELLALLISVIALFIIISAGSYVTSQLLNTGLLLIVVLINTYIWVFKSRFIGLIYPINPVTDE